MSPGRAIATPCSATDRRALYVHHDDLPNSWRRPIASACKRRRRRSATRQALFEYREHLHRIFAYATFQR